MKNKRGRYKNVGTFKYKLLAVLIFILLVSIETVFIKPSVFPYCDILFFLIFVYISGRFSAYLYNREVWG